MSTSTKPVRVWRYARVVVQTVFFIFFFVLVLQLQYPNDNTLHNTVIFGLNPLYQLFTITQAPNLISVIWIIAAAAMVLGLGRVFCGWVCPMGALFDFLAAVKGRLRIINAKSSADLMARKRADRERNARLKLPVNLNFYLLALLITLGLFKVPVFMLVEPITLFFRLCILFILPVTEIPIRASYQTLDKFWGLQSWWFPVQGFMEQNIGSYPRVYLGIGIFITFMATLFVLDWFFPRFWCRFICPQGALFRLGQKLHPFRKRLLPACNNCQLCDNDCSFCGTASDDCFYCMDCEAHCNKQAITFIPSKASTQPIGHVNILNKSEKSSKPFVDKEKISRRLVIQYVAGGAILAPVLKLAGPPVEPKLDFIRPPGVLEKGEIVFNNTCIKCGQCIKICPTNALHPVDLRSGLNGLFTPQVVPRLGYCEYECNLCGKICPSQAIPPLKLEEKKKSIIGTAYVNVNRCIPWISDTPCGVCEEHCPLPEKAITLNKKGRPFVNVEICIGCGFCENKCPLEGAAAINVYRKIVKPDVYEY